MRRRISRIIPTYRRPRSDRSGSGSVTLESALVMPIFLLFILFLIFLAQTAVISMALHGALSQTARQAAAAWYPVALATDKARGSELNRQIEQWNDKWLSVADSLREYGQWLPAPMNEWAERASNVSLSVEEHAAKLAFGELMKQFADRRVLKLSDVRLTSVGLPDVEDRADAYVTLEAEYTLPMRVPFLGRRLVLRESARERAWIGGSPSTSRQTEDEGAGDPFEVSFVSLEPNPVKPGRKATLVIRTAPGAVVDLSILYKSGPSQAKNLGRATADASGLASWTWHVSGRTTPGQWGMQVSNGEGGVWQHSFDVAGKTANEEEKR
ncbi:TadE/TadG family type IV pilus assembly protein [Cohnella sp.]|uniref:TadE/TadG family type IV pilus assembly protein n=1 Tax=Cohnella sp. TaxID=1883426 RepID=UPI003561BD3F